MSRAKARMSIARVNLAALLAACAGGIFWLYFRERVHLSWFRRFVLAVLRTTAVGLVLVDSLGESVGKVLDRDPSMSEKLGRHISEALKAALPESVVRQFVA